MYIYVYIQIYTYKCVYEGVRVYRPKDSQWYEATL